MVTGNARYIILKDFSSYVSEKPKRILELSNLRKAIEKMNAFKWGIDPRGEIGVKNPDGSKVILSPKEGFFVLNTGEFIHCYESYKGICIHLDNEGIVLSCVEHFKTALSCNAHVID